jgi:hypothetical protein
MNNTTVAKKLIDVRCLHRWETVSAAQHGETRTVVMRCPLCGDLLAYYSGLKTIPIKKP